MNRLIERLDRAIEQALIPREMPFLRAERAVLWVRLGRIETARREAAALRAFPEAASNPALQAWILLVEGLADYFEDLNARSRDRVLKAVGLAQSTRAPRILALAAAWCAHLDFRQQDYAACVRHLQQALRTAGPDHVGARARAAVVIAGAYQFSGREDLARPWYAVARGHASREGDGVTLSSIVYNMAALQVIEVRLSDLFGESDSAAARRAIVAIESSASIDRSVQTTAMDAHALVQRAMVLVAHARHADALRLYEELMGQALVQGLSSSECLFQSDRAWCLLRLGRSDDALEAARAGESALLWGTEAEERAVAHGMLCRVYEPLGLAESARRHAGQAAVEWAAHRRRCEDLLAVFQAAGLEALEPGLRPAPG
jgi:tetratricopeptide (TPR) repeat protein